MVRRLIGILGIALIAVVLFTGAAFAQAPTTKQVGLVIAFPDGAKHLEIVTVPGGATTFDALKAAKVNLISRVDAYGPAVCKINNTGCPETDCFCDAAHYWAYYHLSGNAWTEAIEGAGTYVPANGAVEGFAWSGFDANYKPTVQPPVYTFAQILAETAPAPAEVPEPGTMLLLAAGLAGLAGYVKRARR